MADADRNTAVPLPASGFVRQRELLGDRFANPPIPAILPMGKSAWWDGIKSGRYPKPVKLGPNITVWRVEDIRALIEKVGEGAP